MKKQKEPPLTVGWREWMELPELGVDLIKVKIDSGARSSALHCVHIKTYDVDGIPWVKFEIHPVQRNSKITVAASAPVFEFREVKSSNGHTAKRPVIITPISWAGRVWPIELTLASRDSMGFRMLLGRQAMRERLVIDPGKSYLGGGPKSERKKRQPSQKSKRD